jgi:hypothetical protein
VVYPEIVDAQAQGFLFLEDALQAAIAIGESIEGNSHVAAIG